MDNKITTKWKLMLTVAIGAVVGMAGFNFYISNAPSYLTDDPEACINCHIMTAEYTTWQHSSHREHTTCNDCHVPHNNLVRKYYFKAYDGIRHAFMFTFKLDPEVIQLKHAGKTVIQENCLRCHIKQVNPVSATNVTGENYAHGTGKLCWGCHREVPHGRVHSRAATHFALTPEIK